MHQFRIWHRLKSDAWQCWSRQQKTCKFRLFLKKVSFILFLFSSFSSYFWAFYKWEYIPFHASNLACDPDSIIFQFWTTQILSAFWVMFQLIHFYRMKISLNGFRYCIGTNKEGTFSFFLFLVLFSFPICIMHIMYVIWITISGVRSMILSNLFAVRNAAVIVSIQLAKTNIWLMMKIL